MEIKLGMNEKIWCTYFEKHKYKIHIRWWPKIKCSWTIGPLDMQCTMGMSRTLGQPLVIESIFASTPYSRARHSQLFWNIPIGSKDSGLFCYSICNYSRLNQELSQNLEWANIGMVCWWDISLWWVPIEKNWKAMGDDGMWGSTRVSIHVLSRNFIFLVVLRMRTWVGMHLLVSKVTK